MADRRSSSTGGGWRRKVRHWRRTLRRRRRKLRYGRHARRVRRLVLGFVGGLLLLAAGWMLVTGLLARQELEHLRDRVESVRAQIAAGQVTRARREAQAIPAMARRAKDYTSGPAWWVAGSVPYLGDPVDIVRGTTAAAAELGTQVIPNLVDVSIDIDPSSLRTSGNTIEIGRLTAAVPRLSAARTSLARTLTALRHLPKSSWLPTIDAQRDAFSSQLRVVDGYVDAATRVAQTLPTMLGSNGPQRYFVALQNNAELRGTGGLPGAFAIVEARDGRIRFTHFESDAVLAPAATGGNLPTGLQFGKQYDALYAASQPTAQFSDSNVSPEFPYAAQIWARMWEKVSGEHIDGALALDPAALAAFLSATGPAALPSGAVISAENVVSLTGRDQYRLYPDLTRRRAFLVSVLKATAEKVTSGAGDAVGLLNAASVSGKQHRLLVWSSLPNVERALRQTNFAGTLPRQGRPLAAVILNNAAGGKLDYYLERDVQYSRTGCGRTRDVLATITLTNTAPGTGLPPYVSTRIDTPPPGAKPGDNHEILDYYATAGAVLRSVTVDERPATAAMFDDGLGHEVFRLDLELPRGRMRTVELHLQEPGGSGTPVVWRQPGVTPLTTQVLNQSCG